MKQSTATDEEIVRYLLGEMSETEQVAMEEAFVTIPRVFTQVADVENDMIDNYVRGQLTLRQRELFERNVLTNPVQRQRVLTAKTLSTSLDQITAAGNDQPATTENSSRRQRFFPFAFNPQFGFRLSMAMMVLLVSTGVAWLLNETRRLRQELHGMQIDAERREHEMRQQITDEKQRNTRLVDEISQLRGHPAPQATSSPSQTAPGFVTLLLAGGTLRDPGAGKIPHLTIPPNIEQVRLVLKMEDSGHPNYRAELQSAPDKNILTRENLKPNLRRSIATFTVTVPASKLTTDIYTLTLSGISNKGGIDILSKSDFQVEKK